MEIRRNYEQLNTRAKPEVSNLAKKKPKTIKKDVIAQLQLKDKPGKIKLGQVGREHILVLLHTRVGLVCKTVLVGQRWGRGRWPMSPPQQSMSSTGDTRPGHPLVTQSSWLTLVMDTALFAIWVSSEMAAPRHLLALSCCIPIPAPSQHDAGRAVPVPPCQLPGEWQ